MVAHKKSNNLHAVIGLLIIVAVILSIYFYFRYERLYPDTDNAYVNANIVNVAPKVTGYLQTLNVKNNQLVHKGDVLFTINPIDYKLSVTQAEKAYNSQVEQVNAVKSQINIQRGQNIKDKVSYDFALETANRYKKLHNANTISTQNYQNAMTNLDTAKTQLDIDNRKLQQLDDMYRLTIAKRDQSKASLDSAVSNLDYTKYIAPIDGYITNLNTLTPGEYVSAGSQMFGIVDNSNWWIDANFKETQLERIRPGQNVKINLDMYEDHTYNGTVQSLSYASGTTFSLLPAQNATGNWVKVTQRFTVRIKVENNDKYPLRVGSSAKVKVNTN
ncbi:MAG: HlyD family secretion protein [Burkholderiales bacterium]|jgi:membrane fusion protein (multidrug efflux system)|nr:HlyD family secretion protein [Burkholderiales bacterium]